MPRLRDLVVGLLGIIGGILGDLVAAIIERSFLKITGFQLLAIALGIIVAVILTASIGSRPDRDKAKMHEELDRHRQELYRLKKLHDSGMPWQSAHIIAWLDHQREIARIKDTLEDKGCRVNYDPIDQASPPRLGLLERVIEFAKQNTILCAFPLIFSFSLLLSVPAQHGYLKYVAAPTPIPTPVGTPTMIPTAIQTPVGTPAIMPTAIQTSVGTPIMIPTAIKTPVGTPTVTPSPAVELPKSGRIAYTEYVGMRDHGRYDIYVANVDGSGRYRLVERASEPAFSPDGRSLAFFSWTEEGIFVINLDGTGQARVSPDYYDTWPTWSPDQGMIAYAVKREKPQYDIYSTLSRGGPETKIIDGEQPSWGPDGRLVYKGCLISECGLMIVNPADKARIRITTYSNDSNPIWSQVTNKIVFASDRSGNWDIWIVNPDGTGLQQLTTSPHSDATPTWSVDGKWIFFRSDRDGEWAIWAMKLDGSNQVNLFPSRVSGDLRLERLSAGP